MCGVWRVLGAEVAQELFPVGQMDVDDSQRLSSSSSSSMIQLVTEWRTPNVLLGGMSCGSFLTLVLCWGRNRDKRVTISFFEWPGSGTEGCGVSWLLCPSVMVGNLGFLSTHPAWGESVLSSPLPVQMPPSELILDPHFRK